MDRPAATPLSNPRSFLLRGSLSLLFIIGVMAGTLFLSAGRLDWTAAWAVSLLYAAYLAAYLVWGALRAPDLMTERSRVASNVKPWDKVVNILYTAFMLAELILAGLDVGRFGWSRMSAPVQAAGFLALAASAAWIGWTILVNAYLSRWARIQDDRGQRVVADGPYRFIRHPMYAGIILLFAGMALALGSWWALIPAGAIAVLYVVRTALEDRMLRFELAGYPEYAARVRFRLLPGIW